MVFDALPSTVCEKLAAISARGLKRLTLQVVGRLSYEPLEQRPCNLSHLIDLRIFVSPAKEQ
jgi:hypothetical protein